MGNVLREDDGTPFSDGPNDFGDVIRCLIHRIILNASLIDFIDGLRPISTVA